MVGKTLGILIMLAALLAASQSAYSEKIISTNNETDLLRSNNSLAEICWSNLTSFEAAISCPNCSESMTEAALSNKSGNAILGPPTIFSDAVNIKANQEILNFTGTISEASPSPMSDSDILATHNAYRLSVGEDPIVWSTELASYAQNWANYLVANNLFQHSYGPYGENLARGWPSSYWSDTSLVNLWGDEKQYFKCGTFPDVSTTGNWQDVGHYTQMIWPTTIEVGCGVASSDAYGKCLVCEYNPPGNLIGQYTCPTNSYPNKPSIPSGPASGVTSTAYSYSTSATDPDGNQVKYTFDWGDGTNSVTSLVNSGTVASASHTWSAAGTYQVKAMATDSIGAASAWSSGLAVTITSPNRIPNTPSIPSGPASGVAGTAYSYSTSATDPDGNQVKYTFDWGDGATSETSLVNSGAAASASHTWSAAGTYQVKAMATDSIGAASAWSSGLAVTITSPNRTPNTPSIPSGPTTGATGTSYSYSTSATDPDGNQVNYTFDWGDGTTSVTSLVNSGTSASASHTWSAAGTYQVKAMATDSIGAASAWSSGLAVTITGPNRTPNTPSIPSGPTTGATGTSYSYSTSATDPDGNQVEYTFDWGDGNTSVTSLVNSGTSASASHTWSAAGKYLVKALATDSMGATSGWSSILEVTIMAKTIPYAEKWNRTFGTTSNDVGNSVLQTNDGGYVFTGYTWYSGLKATLTKTDPDGNQLWSKTYNNFQSWSIDNTIDGGYILTGNNIIGGGNGGIKLLKTDEDGNEEWAKVFVINSNNDYGSSVQQTLDEGYIITGCIYDAYKTNLLLIKTDSIGNIQWFKSFGKLSDNDDGSSVNETKDGGYIAVGSTESYGAGNGDAWLIKIDSSGNEQWNMTFGGTNQDAVSSVQQTKDSGYIVTGFTSSYGSGGMGDAWLIKTDSSGNEQWNTTFGGASAGIYPGNIGRSVQQTIDNGYIITGHTAFYGAGSADAWLIKTDSSGNEQWNMTFGGIKFDIGRSVQQIRTGGYIIAGTTESYGAGGADAWLIKVGIENTPPISPSIPSGPISGIIGKSYSYSISATDPDDDQIAYTFDWGDGTNSTTSLLDSGAIANATHIWNIAGIYEIKAKATDSKGLDSEWSTSINVSIANNPCISGTKFNDSNSNATRDPGEAGLSGWTIRLTRPDGTSINATTDDSGEYKFENLTSGTYRVSEVRQDNWTQTYPAWLGDHIINVTDGNVTGVDFGNNYLPVPDIPFPPSGPASGTPGAEYSYSTSSTDPSGYQISYTFDWGDGSNSTTGLFDSGAIASAAHIWSSSGVYLVRAMATNSKGARSEWSDPLAVSIANPIFGWKALGGVITSSPSAIIDSQDKTEVWVKGGDNALWLNIDGSWEGKGGYLTSDPFAAEDYNGRIHVLARGGDNGAWDFIYDPVAQSGEWVGLGGYITEGLTTARDPANHNLMRIAARGGDEALWTCDLDINAKSSSWSFHGGVLTSRPYILFDPSGREHILVRGGDNALWDMNGEWTGSSYTRTWSSLGGILVNSPVATIEPGADSRIAVFAKGGDDAIWMCDVDSSSEPETGSWHRLGGVISSEIFAIADPSANRIHSFARGSDMALWENAFTTSPWNPEGGEWQYLGGSILDYRPGATLAGVTQAFVIGTDNGLWQNTQATATATKGDAKSRETDAEKEVQSSKAGQDLRELSQNKLIETRTKLEHMKGSITARQVQAKQIHKEMAAG